ncbi:hypothetical protein GGQ87_000621 [Brevundimonas alba]|uniref:DUF6894 domain-containing protein n=1 Tax=Brevundimonas alba TaxID=74314 RepID=A0A7X5YIG6_9CAUL|nr:hypothetical protein [Brevundimonas alba]NJC40363.1 hypothetical protein [Brevundimonas alba]
MPVYYFHLRDGHDSLLDPDGRKLEGVEAIAQSALAEARALISEEARQGRIRLDQRIDVEDGKGRVVHTQPFAKAVEITGGGG